MRGHAGGHVQLHLNHKTGLGRCLTFKIYMISIYLQSWAWGWSVSVSVPVPASGALSLALILSFGMSSSSIYIKDHEITWLPYSS